MTDVSLGRQDGGRTPAVDAVVVAYASEAVIQQSVASLRADPSVARIVVVNNTPGDGTAAAVGPYDVDLLEPGGNLGYGPGVNFARSHLGDAPYVAVVNPDTVQEPGTAAACAEFLERRRSAALVCPTVVREGAVYRSSEHDISVPRLVLQRFGSPAGLGIQRSRRAHTRAHRTQVVNFAWFVARRAALDDTGWYDDDRFLYGEELAVCRRLRQAGHEIWYAPIGRVEHIGGHSTRTLDDGGVALVRAARVTELRRSRGDRAAALYEWLSRRVNPTPRATDAGE